MRSATLAVIGGANAASTVAAQISPAAVKILFFIARPPFAVSGC
jgi:hypothetical protein